MTKKLCEYRCVSCPLEACKVEGMTPKMIAVRKYHERYHDIHRQSDLEKCSAWYKANKEKAAASARRWREEHREEHNARIRAWRAEHREEYNARARERLRKQRGGAPRIPMTPEERKAVAREKNKAYRMANPEKEAAHEQMFDAGRSLIPAGWPPRGRSLPV